MFAVCWLVTWFVCLLTSWWSLFLGGFFGDFLGVFVVFCLFFCLLCGVCGFWGFWRVSLCLGFSVFVAVVGLFWVVWQVLFVFSLDLLARGFF